MKLDCQNGKNQSRVRPGLFELLHKIIGKNDVEKKTQEQKTPYKGKQKTINP